jgi:chromosome segregation ATPase
MTHSAGGSAQHSSAAGVLNLLHADREQLTHLLRGLASRLDDLDRQLADLTWRHRRPRIGVRLGETVCERTALESERERLTERLGALAQRLNILDSKLSGADAELSATTLVGTCPYCGYPSLGSGLCAFCRPPLDR